MTFAKLLEDNSLMLTECAVSERLRRMPDIELDPVLFNTVLIYDPVGRKRLEQIYLSYRRVAEEAKLPILLCAPTWRVDRERIELAGVPQSINRDAVAFMKRFKAQHETGHSALVAGALIAPKNDCYSADLGLSRSESAEFHGWQIDELAGSDAEVIIAQTIPSVSESLGMSDRLAVSGKPYIISFVINRFGRVLDGTPLAEAIDQVDQASVSPPAGYMVNCVYPTFLDMRELSSGFLCRLVGIQANASSRDHDQLDGADQLQQDPLQDWGQNMLKLHRDHGLKILGGCCGTDHTYLQFLVDNL